MTTKNMGRNQALVAALTLLGASLGVNTPVDAGTNTETSSYTVKGHATTTGTQIAEQRHRATMDKARSGTTATDEEKFGGPGAANQAKFVRGVQKNYQSKGKTKSTQVKLNPNGGSQTH